MTPSDTLRSRGIPLCTTVTEALRTISGDVELRAFLDAMQRPEAMPATAEEQAEMARLRARLGR